MAIVQTGSVLQFPGLGSGNTGTVSTTITVPADAELVVVGWSGFSNTSGYFSGGGMTFTKGGADTAMTSVAGGDTAGSNWGAGYFYLVLPDTGSNKTLKWDWLGTAVADSANNVCSVTFWKGLDTASPTRGTGAGQSGTTPPYTTGTITAASGDLIIAWVAGFVTAEGTINTWSNLSLLSQIAANGPVADGAWATGSPSGNVTVAASTGTNFDDGSIVAVAFKAAAAAAGKTPYVSPWPQLIAMSLPWLIFLSTQTSSWLASSRPNARGPPCGKGCNAKLDSRPRHSAARLIAHYPSISRRNHHRPAIRNFVFSVHGRFEHHHK